MDHTLAASGLAQQAGQDGSWDQAIGDTVLSALVRIVKNTQPLCNLSQLWQLQTDSERARWYENQRAALVQQLMYYGQVYEAVWGTDKQADVQDGQYQVPYILKIQEYLKDAAPIEGKDKNEAQMQKVAWRTILGVLDWNVRITQIPNPQHTAALDLLMHRQEVECLAQTVLDDSSKRGLNAHVQWEKVFKGRSLMDQTTLTVWWECAKEQWEKTGSTSESLRLMTQHALALMYPIPNSEQQVDPIHKALYPLTQKRISKVMSVGLMCAIDEQVQGFLKEKEVLEVGKDQNSVYLQEGKASTLSGKIVRQLFEPAVQGWQGSAYSSTALHAGMHLARWAQEGLGLREQPYALPMRWIVAVAAAQRLGQAAGRWGLMWQTPGAKLHALTLEQLCALRHEQAARAWLDKWTPASLESFLEQQHLQRHTVESVGIKASVRQGRML